MIISIIVIILSLILLMALHEFGHFIAAKSFGVKVEEFGIGYPPRIFGKKWGETVYSLNLLPFGAFVKILGEDEETDHKRSFSQQPIWKRIVVTLGGVASFWLIAIVMYGIVIACWGMLGAIDDKMPQSNASVIVLGVTSRSPADLAGVKLGDIIVNVKGTDTDSIAIDKVSQVQEIVSKHKGDNLVLTLKRGDKLLDVPLVPRKEFPSNEGPMGVGLARIAKMYFPWYEAPYQGAKLVARQTILMAQVLKDALFNLVRGKRVEGIQLVGPIGIGAIMNQAITQGVDIFLSYLGMIAVWMALFNVFPIPALDGGKLLFLIIEAIRKKPVPMAVEQRVSGAFFLLLIFLMAVITIKDIIGLF